MAHITRVMLLLQLMTADTVGSLYSLLLSNKRTMMFLQRHPFNQQRYLYSSSSSNNCSSSSGNNNSSSSSNSNKRISIYLCI